MEETSKKKIFLLGRFSSRTDEGRMNLNILESLETCYELMDNYQKNVLKILVQIKRCDIVFICSDMEKNSWIINIAHICKKKIIYLMHSAESYEDEEKLGRGRVDFDTQLGEVFSKVDRIICTSLRTKRRLGEIFPKYMEKISVIYDCLDFKMLAEGESIRGLREEQVLTTEDGVVEKDNSSIAKAIFNLDSNLKYYVVGQGKINRDIIEKYPNVVIYNHMPGKEIYKFMQTSTIYVENNVCQVFGIEAIEALYFGCSLLVSQQIESLELFENLTENDIIYNIYDVREVERKLQYLRKHENNQRLRYGLNWGKITREYQVKEIEKIISEL